MWEAQDMLYFSGMEMCQIKKHQGYCYNLKGENGYWEAIGNLTQEVTLSV